MTLDGYARLRVMFIDDALPTRVMLREMLRGTGLQHVAIMDDATSAFEAIKRDPPDIVFTDWEMPVRSGLDLLRDIRRHPDSPDPLMAVILLTAKDHQEHVMLSRDAGATGYLIKPIRLGCILDAIKSCVVRPCAFVASNRYVGPDRRRSKGVTAVASRIETLEDGSLFIPPDHLLAAKVRGDRAALLDAWQARTDAIALLRRFTGPRDAARTAMQTDPVASPT